MWNLTVSLNGMDGNSAELHSGARRAVRVGPPADSVPHSLTCPVAVAWEINQTVAETHEKETRHAHL